MASQRAGTPARSGGLLGDYFITKLMNLTGIAIGINELIIRGDGRAYGVAFAAFLCSGAQGLDSFLKWVSGPR